MADRLVHVPEERTVPDELLERLRRIHPQSELVYAGEGRWLYGYVSPEHSARRAIGERMMAREMAREVARRNPRNIQFAQLALQGFQLVQMLEDPNPESIIPLAEWHAHLAQKSEKELDEMFEKALDSVTIEDAREEVVRREFADLARREMPTILRVVRHGPTPMSFRPLLSVR